MTDKPLEETIEQILESLQKYEYDIKEELWFKRKPTDGTSLERAKSEILKLIKEAEKAQLKKDLKITKELWQENFMYRTLAGDYHHNGIDIKKAFVEYQELEPERKKFADYIEQRLSELKEVSE